MKDRKELESLKNANQKEYNQLEMQQSENHRAFHNIQDILSEMSHEGDAEFAAELHDRQNEFADAYRHLSSQLAERQELLSQENKKLREQIHDHQGGEPNGRRN